MQIIAIASGLAAGALWALAFIAPALVSPFDGTKLTLLRYAVFGISSGVVLALLPRERWWPLAKAYWPSLLVLALAGNTLYYLLLSEALQLAGTLLPTMIIGTLPVVIPAIAGVQTGLFSARRLFWPGLLILSGLGLHISPVGEVAAKDGTIPQTSVGTVLALAALVSWAVYGLKNAALLASFQRADLVTWTALIGVATLGTLPLVVVFVLLDGSLMLDAGQWQPWLALIFWGLVLGLLSSWVATWLWNLASCVLTGEVLGYLIVSETVFAILYNFLVERRFPNTFELPSLVLLVSGVAIGIHTAPRSKLSAS
ncbi:hypothetical protein [Bradyrhizobium japonicum]|uniref:hypothetical protein n=1 Tax=Bradyrhizobium japonicum TaxID=375 RepID=UPI001269E37A|nr:hypothetical protein [Bradyrhizobium japonicum]